MSDRAISLRLDLEWRISLLTLVLLPALVLLGFWQLQRADEKATLATTWEMRRHQPAVPLTALDQHLPAALAYTPVELTGRFLQGRYFLLDNRINGGRFGYEVLALFEQRDPDLIVLVNRGWVAGDSVREILPEIPPVVGNVQITGHVYVSPGSPYLLAEQVLGPGWPKRIQAVEMNKLSPAVEASTGAGVYPFPVRINEAEPGALTVDWKIVNVSPEKHRGYAVQWFTMAAVLGLFFVFRSSNLWQLLTQSRQESK